MIPSPAPSLAEQIADLAESIVNSFEESHYTYTEHIDVACGVYDCDCAELVGYVLETIAPDDYISIPKEPNHHRPRAFEYFLFFTSPNLSSESGWSQVQRLTDARRGDIIAWQLPASEDGDTGHVVFVADRPQLMDSGTYAVRVYDSADVPHFEDTRDSDESGVGTGFINFMVDDAGLPTAFQFGPSKDQFAYLPIAIGRI